jgi:hypothetical protein
MHRERATMLELGSLVRRDHDDLHYALRVMAEPLSDEQHVIAMLERLIAVFPAHVEAETMALHAALDQCDAPPSLYFLVSQVVAAHLAQETALAELVRLRPSSSAFRDRARYLRHMMVHHADHEIACLHPALPDHVPREVFTRLAGAYTAERDRLLEEHAAAAERILDDVG